MTPRPDTALSLTLAAVALVAMVLVAVWVLWVVSA